MKYNLNLLMLAGLLIISAPTLWSQTMKAVNVLERSIQYHDPQGKLSTHSLDMKLNQLRPDGSERKTQIWVGLNSPYFASIDQRNDITINMNNLNGQVEFQVGDDKQPSQDKLDELKLNEDRFHLMHNYYRYLWLAPLVLNDPGTTLIEQASLVDFDARQVWQIKVTYDPEVGSDIWYFYFDPNTFAMVGYCFFKDSEETKGEYILLEGEIEQHNVRIPASRKWYIHENDKYLGNDILLDFKLEKNKKKAKKHEFS